MLHIYYGSGTAHKEKYIFDSIDTERKTIIIVPDQFSLQAERDAFRLTGRESLTNLMVVDFSALGHKVVHEVDGHEPEVIDKYGRHMLLTVLIDDLAGELETYGSFKGRNSFTDHVNTMISQLKRYEITPEELGEVCEKLREERDRSRYNQAYLAMKLADILKIYTAYEDAVKGIYQDSEDYITYYAERMSSSELVNGADIWIYGFDSFTPRNLTVIKQLIAAGENVSVVLTGGTAHDPARELTLNGGENLFEITETVSRRLEALAEELGIAHDRKTMGAAAEGATDDGAATAGADSPAAAAVRENIWTAYGDELDSRIRLVQTTDHYHEAERAAAYVRHLVRDEGYRYGDITLICNDSADLGGMVARALRRINVPVFSDRRRSVLHQPVVSFLLSFLDVMQRGYQSNGLLGMIKSGLLGLEQRQENLIENYAFEFGIRSGKWKKPFRYRSDRYTEEELEELNQIREFLVDTCDRARDSIGRRNTAEEKVKGLYEFLEDDFGIRTRIESIINAQREMGLEEGAAETTQIWNGVCGIFDQIIRVVGQRRISNQTLADMIRAGLTSMEIGLVPFSGDSLLMGTMQRTRPGQVKALIVVGAEDGLLPLHGREEGLLTRQEIELLDEMELELARRDAVSAQEEQMAIYRMFSAPTERIYVSCSRTGSGGSVTRPSYVFEKLKKYQPEVLQDLEMSGMLDSVVDSGMTVSYLARAMRDGGGSGWDAVYKWYEKEAPRALGRIARGSRHNNMMENLGEEMARALFVGDRDALTVSASRLELFNGCPFAHFIQYGLGPVEQRLFEVGGREIGDIYHQCIMKYCERLNIAGAGSGQGDEGACGIDDITREKCGEMIRQIIAEEKDYQEGLFESDEENRFRLERVTEICGDIAWAVTMQIKQGRINSMKFEEGFGYEGELAAREIDAGGRKARIVGRIDRMDVMGAGGESAVRIIDYKTGSREIDPEEIRQGFQLQLAVYMDAAMGAENASLKPAGIFYFKIKEFMEELEPGSELSPEDVERQLKKAYRLEGIAVDDPSILSSMDKSLLPEDKYESSVVPVKYEPKKEAFSAAKGGALMTPEEFGLLLEESRKMTEDICRRIYDGSISPQPHNTGRKNRSGEEITACTYCDFGSICMHSI